MTEDSEKTQILINARLDQADSAFNSGKLLLEQEFYNDCVNRFYYSMFYAVLALLLTRNLGSSKHKGVIALFDKEFVRTGDFSKEKSKWLHSIFQQRLETDYGEQPEITPEKAIEMKDQADNFIQAIKSYLHS